MPKPKKSPKPIDDLIHTIRGQKVILDTDLAELYGVPTKVLNQAVKRNQERFPQDFMFQLSNSEWSDLRSQIVTSSLEPNKGKGLTSNWSQSVTSSSKNRGASYRPHAFTEQLAIVAEIKAEQALVNANREHIARFEAKIQTTLSLIWGDA